jgi:tetratricopeptide (TPR) repeat protein
MTLFLLIATAIMAVLRDFCKKSFLKIMVSLFICTIITEQGYTVIQRNALFKHPLHLWHDNAIKSPGLSRVYTNLGRIYSEMGMLEAAKQSFGLSIEADRYHQLKLRAVPLHNLGNCYLQQGEIDKAIHFYEKALSVNPVYSNCRLNLANALILEGDIDRAKTEIEKLLDNASEKDNIQILSSVISLKQGNYRHAIRDAHRAIAMNADLYSARKIIGEAYMRLENYTLAKKYWLECRKKFPQDMETLLAVLHLAHNTNDQILLHQSAVDLLSLKKNRSWEEIIKDYKLLSKRSIIVFSAEPEEILPLVRKGLEIEITQLPKPDVKGNMFPCVPQ